MVYLRRFRENDKLNSLEQNLELENLKTKYYTLSGDYEILKTKNDELVNKIEKLTSEKKYFEQKIEKLLQRSLEFESKELISNDQERVIFFKGPTENYFLSSNIAKSKEEIVYKFEIESNRIEASFRIIVDDVILQSILRLGNTYLRPACIELNSYDSFTKKIVTIEPGKAKLIGDKWIIDKKAEITYE